LPCSMMNELNEGDTKMTRKKLSPEQKLAHRQHQQKWKQKKLNEGWKQLQFWVPPARIALVKEAVARVLCKPDSMSEADVHFEVFK